MVGLRHDLHHWPGESACGLGGGSCDRGGDWGSIVRHARPRSRHRILQRRRVPCGRSPLEWFFLGSFLSHHQRGHHRGPRGQGSSRHQARCADLLDRGKRRDRTKRCRLGEHAIYGRRLRSHQGVLRHHWLSRALWLVPPGSPGHPVASPSWKSDRGESMLPMTTESGVVEHGHDILAVVAPSVSDDRSFRGNPTA